MRLGAGVGTFGLVCHCICLSISALSFLILSCARGLRVVVEVCRGRGVQEAAGAYCRIRGWAEDRSRDCAGELN
jgi:hypothetical protein